MKWFDLVGVKFGDEVKLYQAPGWSGIKEGDEVLVETGINDVEFGEALGVALTVNSVTEDSEVLQVLLKHYDQTLPLPKVIGHKVYIEMEYKEEEQDG